jgi:hypothetical protein
MGFEDYKMTRRIALGTIAGGLAATSVVVHVLRRSRTKLEGAFDKEWKDYFEDTQVTIRDITGPEAFSIAFAPPVGGSYRFTYLYASYEGARGDWATEDVPSSFGVRQGKFSILGTGEGAYDASGHTDVNRFLGKTVSRELPTGDWLLHLKNKERWLPLGIKQAGSSGKAALVPATLALPIPDGVEYRIGSSWTSPASFLDVGSDAEITSRIVGFANVAGIETVKVQVASAAGKGQAAQGSVQEMKDALIKLGHSEAEAARVAVELAKTMGQIASEGAMTVDGLAYVDLRSGITVRVDATSRLDYRGQVASSRLVYQTFVS